MISSPVISVRCDQKTTGDEPCRRAEVFTLPSFVTSREHAGNLFAVTHPDWHVTETGAVYCPQCKVLAIQRAIAERERRKAQA